MLTSIDVPYNLCSGNVKLPNLFPFLGKTQLQVLSVLSALLLLVTNGTTAYAVRERVLLEPPRKRMLTETPFGIFGTVRDIWMNALTLPYVIMRIVRMRSPAADSRANNGIWCIASVSYNFCGNSFAYAPTTSAELGV